MDLNVVVWIKEFLLGRSQGVGVDEQISEEVRVTSCVLQGTVLGNLLFLAYVIDVRRKRYLEKQRVEYTAILR